MPVLLVFGARNLGRTIASVFSADGWSIAAVAASEETIDAFRSALPGALGLAGDARQESDVQYALDATRNRFGSLDLVVNAVGTRSRGGSLGRSACRRSRHAMEPYVDELVPAIFNVVRLGGRALVEGGGETLVQITGGSARRAIGGRGPWRAGGGVRDACVLQSAALELRERGVHAALLIVDATIASRKNAAQLVDRQQDETTTEQDVAAAVRYLAEQSPRGVDARAPDHTASRSLGALRRRAD